MTIIEQYIENQPVEEEVKQRLLTIYETLKITLPNAEERISWSMPTFWKGRNLIHFAAFKKHIGIYPGAEAVEVFSEQLKDYKTSKGAIQLPNNKPLPLDLIAEIALWSESTNAK